MYICLNKYANEKDIGDTTTYISLDVRNSVLTFCKNGISISTMPVSLTWNRGQNLELIWYIDAGTGTVYVC
jgi:hypothetical protein